MSSFPRTGGLRSWRRGYSVLQEVFQSGQKHIHLSFGVIWWRHLHQFPVRENFLFLHSVGLTDGSCHSGFLQIKLSKQGLQYIVNALVWSYVIVWRDLDVMRNLLLENVTQIVIKEEVALGGNLWVARGFEAVLDHIP